MKQAPHGALRHIRADSLLLRRLRITLNELKEGALLKQRGGEFQNCRLNCKAAFCQFPSSPTYQLSRGKVYKI